jgi:hypothetical protein
VISLFFDLFFVFWAFLRKRMKNNKGWNDDCCYVRRATYWNLTERTNLANRIQVKGPIWNNK